MTKPYATNEHRKYLNTLRHTHLNRKTDTRSMSNFSDAIWAANMAKLYGRQPIHIRQLHYFALSCASMSKPDGQPYKNSISDYDFLSRACHHARCLDLLTHESFTTAERICEPQRFSACRHLSHKHQWQNFFKQKIKHLCQSYTRTLIAEMAPVHVEIWIENSTASEMLRALANKYIIDLIACENEMSLTTVLHFIRHISLSKRPVRILYLSDLACKKEQVTPPAQAILNSLMDQYCLSKKLDIRLEHVLLTAEQRERFGLPCRPQSGDLANKNSNENVVEIHSLEAVKPGYIVKKLDSRIGQYLNSSDIAKAIRIICPLLRHVVCNPDNPTAKSRDIETVIHSVTENLSAQGGVTFSCDATQNNTFKQLHP